MRKKNLIFIFLLAVSLIAIIIKLFNLSINEIKIKNNNSDIVNQNDNSSMNSNTSNYSKTTSGYSSNTSDYSKINVIFKKHTDKDNIIPEDLINLQESDIKEVYDKLEYHYYEFILCTDIHDTLHIAYSYNGSYYSIGQIESWSEQYVSGYTSGDEITEFENVLGYSGVKVRIISGAAAAYVSYIAIDKHPFLLLSDSLGGDFTEFDIDEDGQKELLAFDHFMYINVNNELYKAKYDFDKTRIMQIYFNDETEQYEVYFSDGKKYNGITKGYKYDSKQKCLIKIPG